MDDTADDAGVFASLEEIKAHQTGADPPGMRVRYAVDVQSIRKRLGLTQAAFCERFGFSLATLKDWEGGRRTPEFAARVLLRIIDEAPEVVDKALAGETP